MSLAIANSAPAGRASTERRPWRVLAVVIGALLVTVLGGYATASILTTSIESPVGFEGIVRIHPLSGWSPAGRGVVGSWPFVRVTRGSGSLDLAVAPATTIAGAGAGVAATRYVDDVLQSTLVRLTVSERLAPVRVDGGVEGVRFAYTGVGAETHVSIEGEVTVVIAPSGPVVFDVWAPEGLLRFVLPDANVMIDAAELR
jgi:hypothetical protein